MALRLASLLGLPNSQVAHYPLAQEHRKRVWWTAVCMDIMTCTELSLTPNHVFNENTCEFPGSMGLTLDGAEEFADPQYLTALVKFVRIKYHITKTTSELR